MEITYIISEGYSEIVSCIPNFIYLNLCIAITITWRITKGFS